MVARLVRDQEVVGSNPVASTNKNRRFSACFYFFEEAIRDSRGASKLSLRWSAESTDDKTADSRCFPTNEAFHSTAGTRCACRREMSERICQRANGDRSAAVYLPCAAQDRVRTRRESRRLDQ